MTAAATPDRVHRLLLSLFREADALTALHQGREALFDRYELDADERAALRDGSFSALCRIGVHPILRMHYQMAMNPDMAQHVSIRGFLTELEKGQGHG